jgi:peptide chain release factor 3
MMQPDALAPTAQPADRLRAEVERRRTFAIISHPDAGKTTLTEKLLLYGGAIHLAGSVKSRRADRHASSDWMELEKQRGISVTSSVLQFDYAGCRVNLLDTPGHADFSEDTYRTLVAADSAVMLLDNRKGVEDRTRQLFQVCRRRRMPIFTFVNKCDRIGADPLQLVSDVEADLGIQCVPLTWPIFQDNDFVGVFDRQTREAVLFEKSEDRGASRVEFRRLPHGSAEFTAALEPSVRTQLEDELSLLDEVGHPFDLEAVLAGEQTPVYFGSALSNFGVEPFLEDFLRFAPAPLPREASTGPVSPFDDGFTAFVFKIQANMDPRHRDRVAFMRICSGRFEPGMDVLVVRTGKTLRLTAPQQFLARERSQLEEAWPGDVVGIIDRHGLRIGDTLSTAGKLAFADIPRFPPEHFVRVLPTDPLRRKQLDLGLRQLSEEGAAQVFFPEGGGGQSPIVGAVGQLQFDVMQFRLENEYGAPCRLEPLVYGHPRWLTGDADQIDALGRRPGCLRLTDGKGAPVALFENVWTLRTVQNNATGIEFHDVAP